MTSDLSQTTKPVAFSFKEFRDEEIVDFFANENRTFQSATADGGVGRSLLVGSPHFAASRKGTAGFRTSFRSNGRQSEQTPPRCGILREETVASIPIPPDILSANPSVLSATITEAPKKKHKTVEPSFGKPARSLASVLMMDRKNTFLKDNFAAKVVYDPVPTEAKNSTQDSLIETVQERIRETDEQLNHLIETWPRLSAELKETITALLEGSERAESP